MRWTALIPILLTVLGPALLSGCGPASATVSGTVTVDGKPVERGSITYSAADEIPGTATSEITGGAYQIKTVVGKKHVMISALKVIGKRKESDAPDSPIVELTEEILPARFNTETQLTFEVKAGANPKDWNLNTKEKLP